MLEEEDFSSLAAEVEPVAKATEVEVKRTPAPVPTTALVPIIAQSSGFPTVNEMDNAPRPVWKTGDSPHLFKVVEWFNNPPVQIDSVLPTAPYFDELDPDSVIITSSKSKRLISKERKDGIAPPENGEVEEEEEKEEEVASKGARSAVVGDPPYKITSADSKASALSDFMDATAVFKDRPTERIKVRVRTPFLVASFHHMALAELGKGEYPKNICTLSWTWMFEQGPLQYRNHYGDDVGLIYWREAARYYAWRLRATMAAMKSIVEIRSPWAHYAQTEMRTEKKNAAESAYKGRVSDGKKQVDNGSKTAAQQKEDTKTWKAELDAELAWWPSKDHIVAFMLNVSNSKFGTCTHKQLHGNKAFVMKADMSRFLTPAETKRYGAPEVKGQVRKFPREFPPGTDQYTIDMWNLVPGKPKICNPPECVPIIDVEVPLIPWYEQSLHNGQLCSYEFSIGFSKNTMVAVPTLHVNDKVDRYYPSILPPEKPQYGVGPAAKFMPRYRTARALTNTLPALDKACVLAIEYVATDAPPAAAAAEPAPRGGGGGTKRSAPATATTPAIAAKRAHVQEDAHSPEDDHGRMYDGGDDVD
jgi:hypothetical protein